MSEIRLDLLPVFVAVAETNSFSLAATRLGIAKSSISRSISELESALDVRLFQRSTRHVALSTAGQALFDKVSTRLRELQATLGDLPEQEEEPSGRLRVTAAVDIGAAVLAEVATRFCQRYPKVELDMHLSNSMVDLVAEGFDLALRISSKPLKDSALLARNLGRISLGLYAAPIYLARCGTPRTPEEAQAHEWVRFAMIRQLTLQRRSSTGAPLATGAAKLIPKGRLTCDEMLFARESAIAGMGITLMPTLLAEQAVTEGKLVHVMPKWFVDSGSLYLVTTAAKNTPRKVTVFKSFIQDALKAQLL